MQTYGQVRFACAGDIRAGVSTRLYDYLTSCGNCTKLPTEQNMVFYPYMFPAVLRVHCQLVDLKPKRRYAKH